MFEHLLGLICVRDTPRNKEIWEARCKFLAKILLIDSRKSIRPPTKEEWVGLNMLQRDGEL